MSLSSRSASGLQLTMVGFLAFCIGCSRSALPLPNVPNPTATPEPSITFPRDAGPHDALTEWWYVTGHLRSELNNQDYGFEFTVFQARRQDAPVGYLAHFAVSDIAAQRFSHQARFSQGEPREGFPLEVDGWSLATEGDSDVILASMRPAPGADSPYSLRLRLADQKLPALHHGGYVDLGAAGGTHYYSRTRLALSGSLQHASDEPMSVSGIGWMDHQWGNFLVAGPGGWDWYSLQLDDRTELMLYVLRGASSEATGVYGSYVLADGSVRDLEPGSVRTSSTGSWLSPHTGAVYPSGWQLTLPDGARLTLTPRLVDQELFFPEATVRVAAYWEGAVSVSGDRSGVGYVELTGYAR
jgi:predicted secreted hydrolase